VLRGRPSPNAPLLLSFNRQVIDAVLVGIFLVLGFDFIEIGAALLLCELLTQDCLVTLIALLLCVDIVKNITLALLLEECLVFVLFFKALLLDLLDFTLSALSKLISHWHAQVLFPEFELSLELCVVGHLGEEAVLGVWGERHFLQLALHAINHLLALATAHIV